MRVAAIFATLSASALLSCDGEVTQIYVARCINDTSCQGGAVCIDGTCVDRDTVSCQSIEGGQAILQPGPPLMDFGHTGANTSNRELVLRNIGNCTLTVFEAYFEKEENSPFTCPFCAPENFPVELFPFREHPLNVFFTPLDVGEYDDVLILLSDDAEFSEIRIPVRARFNGIPQIAIAPEQLDFDYAPVGRTITRTLRITNRGSGTAPLEIQKLEVESATVSAFTFEPEIAPSRPVVLNSPATGSDDELIVNVRYHPREIENHTGNLVITTNQPRNRVLRVPLTGSSQTPAKIKVSPERINFGPVPIGQTTALPLTILNEGGTPLRLTYRWTGTGLSTDLSALPLVVPPIAPGNYTEMQILVTATAPAPITGLLLIESNDPMRPTITVPVSADGQDVVGAQVIKIDMNFENGSDSAFDEDFRNVDMTLESPFGLVCNEQNATPNWMSHGNPTWIAFGVKKEPERVVLPNSMADGTYRVMVSYVEDCSSLPSGLLTSILGISLNALLAYLTGGASIGISGTDIAEVIEQICFNRSSSAVTLTISINGQIAAEVPVTLGRKGDYLYAADIIRQGGQYTVRR